MAISDSQKVDYLWKKLGYGAAKTDTNAKKLAPNEAISSPLIVRGDRVWQQSILIPTVMPSADTEEVAVYLTTAPDECANDATASANRTWLTGLTDWIPPEMGSTYQVKVYIHTAGDAAGASGGDQVFATGSGNDDEWFFDYQAGVLHFIGANLPDGVNFTGKSVYISGARYIGTFGVGGSGEDQKIGNLEINDTTITSVPPEKDHTVDAEDGMFIIAGNAGVVIPMGTTSQRRDPAMEGTLRYNTTLDQLEIYEDGEWNGTSDVTTEITNQDFNGDGSTTDFTLNNSATTNTLFVSINGTLQAPTTAYTVSGTTLTFSEAPATGDKIQARRISESRSVEGISNTTGNAFVQSNDDGTVDIQGSEVNLTGLLKQPPTTKAANASGKTGQIAWDDEYIYICTATDTWKRTALTGGY